MKTEKLAHWAEIISSLAVVVTLVFLVHEVQRNTRALERQADMDRAAVFNDPFFEAPELASVLAKIKVVDGPEGYPLALSENYGLTMPEAILWDRHVWQSWSGFEADFYRIGASSEVGGTIRFLLQFPDQGLYWSEAGQTHKPEFGAFVDSIAAEIETGS